jgi:hypothetical protein
MAILTVGVAFAIGVGCAKALTVLAATTKATAHLEKKFIYINDLKY